MKKIICYILFTVIVFSITGCKNTNDIPQAVYDLGIKELELYDMSVKEHRFTDEIISDMKDIENEINKIDISEYSDIEKLKYNNVRLYIMLIKRSLYDFQINDALVLRNELAELLQQPIITEWQEFYK